MISNGLGRARGRRSPSLRARLVPPSIVWWLAVAAAPGCSAGPGADRADATLAPPDAGARWTALALGKQHSCALRSDGTLYCWGLNDRGQLGDGTTEQRLEPTRVSGVDDIVQITAGEVHTCALRRAGTLWCWGDNSRQQLGAAVDLERSAAPRQALVDVSHASAGQRHTCAIRRTGSLDCWGDNEAGQLGLGDDTRRLEPSPVPGLSELLEVSAGTQHTCARDRSRRLFCWGRNDSGQLGDGSTEQQPSPVQALAEVHAFQVGDRSTCAVVGLNEQVHCWGGNWLGQLGNGATEQRTTATPNGVEGASAIGAGLHHFCAVAGGALSCWGLNDDGQLGLGSSERALSPRRLEGLASVLSVEGGHGHTCALDRAGTITCWGANAWGQLGDGHRDSYTPAPVPELERVERVSSGGRHTCAQSASAGLVCWGRNLRGELGSTARLASAEPVGVAELAELAIDDLSLGFEHSCVVTGGAGEVWCWGENKHGQLGRGSTQTNPQPPARVPDLAGVVQVVATDESTCARLRAGGVRCWGNNFAAQLGQAKPGLSSRPVEVPLSDGTLEDLAGGAHSYCARLDGGTRVLCWGDNRAGQLGDGTRQFRSSPVSVALEPSLRIRQVAVASRAACASTTAGEVLCWGEAPALGDGSRGLRATPGEAVLDGVIQLAAGGEHFCALRSRDDVRCWGTNTYGQVDPQQGSDAYLPRRVEGLTGVVALALGWRHSCAQLADGRLSCWGSNASGQLGRGTVDGATRPRAVAFTPR